MDGEGKKNSLRPPRAILSSSDFDESHSRFVFKFLWDGLSRDIILLIDITLYNELEMLWNCQYFKLAVMIFYFYALMSTNAEVTATAPIRGRGRRQWWLITRDIVFTFAAKDEVLVSFFAMRVIYNASRRGYIAPAKAILRISYYGEIDMKNAEAGRVKLCFYIMIFDYDDSHFSPAAADFTEAAWGREFLAHALPRGLMAGPLSSLLPPMMRFRGSAILRGLPHCRDITLWRYLLLFINFMTRAYHLLLQAKMRARWLVLMQAFSRWAGLKDIAMHTAMPLGKQLTKIHEGSKGRHSLMRVYVTPKLPARWLSLATIPIKWEYWR